MTGEKLVVVRNLVKTFVDGDVATEVLKGVNLTLEKGELCALLGPSGSGKSTLLTILGTLAQATSGSHVMLGRDLMAAGNDELTEFRNAHIGFVFQFHHLLPDFTALENVAFPASLRRGRETAVAIDRARELLARVGLEDRADFRASRLSGGQKQRVAVARALMNRPELVLADEPTGNLDKDSARQVLDLIAEISESENTSYLISTHDDTIAARCRRQIRVANGLVA
jgi:lipoprotein-releasing system ATP-binding protein